MNSPFVEIIEQPAAYALRFRYQRERQRAAFVVGERSDPDVEITYPTIKVHGYRGRAAIVISCVTKTDPPRPHPNKLIGESCVDGIYRMKVDLNDVNGIVSFNNISIECVKKKEIKGSLEARRKVLIDPFKTGFEHMHYPQVIDCSIVRLCFQVFGWIIDSMSSVSRWEPLPPVVSVPIFDRKIVQELKIFKLSVYGAPVSGGTEVILLCGRVVKDNIRVRFFELRNNTLFWESYGVFKASDVYKQVAIVFKTPKYCNQEITETVHVKVQLQMKTDPAAVSDPTPFSLFPLHDYEEDSLNRKRMKIINETGLHLEDTRVLSEVQHNRMNQIPLHNHYNPQLEAVAGPSGVGFVPRPTPNFNENRMNQIPLHNNYNPQLEAVAGPSGGGFVPRPTPNFQENNSIHQLIKLIENIPVNQQINFEGQGSSQARYEAPFPQPGTAPQVDFSSLPQPEPELRRQFQQ